MKIARALDDLRAGHRGCDLVAFGDLGTRLVLRSSCDATRPQEFFDQLCSQAARAFALSDGLPRPEGQEAGDEVVVLTPLDTRVFVRSAGDGSDFIGCIGDDDLHTGDMAKAGAAILADSAVTP